MLYLIRGGKMNLKEELEKYIPFNEQEERDKEQFLKFIDTFHYFLAQHQPLL